MSGASVAALGAGRMGRGIALAFALAGERVLLVDAKQRTEEAFAKLAADARGDLAEQVAALVAVGVVPENGVGAILARITLCDTRSASDHLAPVTLLFEGVPEVMEAKAHAFKIACASLPPHAIVASTSSSFLSTALAPMVRTPRRFLNAHWLNPAHLIPLVELSPHPDTDPAVTAALRERLEAIGKVVVVCEASPGYIVPRMQALIMNEAARMIEEGVATAEDIDRATRYGFGIRYAAMGVTEFIDVGGNDILYYASRYLAHALASERYASPPIVHRLMAEGRNGLRDGQGFHDWRGRDVDEYRRNHIAQLVELLKLIGREPHVGSTLT